MKITRGGFEAFGKRAERLVHWNGSHRCSIPGRRPGASRRRNRHVRTRRAHGVAYSSSWADAVRRRANTSAAQRSSSHSVRAVIEPLTRARSAD